MLLAAIGTRGLFEPGHTFAGGFAGRLRGQEAGQRSVGSAAATSFHPIVIVHHRPETASCETLCKASVPGSPVQHTVSWSSSMKPFTGSHVKWIWCNAAAEAVVSYSHFTGGDMKTPRAFRDHCAQTLIHAP